MTITKHKARTQQAVTYSNTPTHIMQNMVVRYCYLLFPLEANIQGKANHIVSSSIAIQAAWDKAFWLASHREDSNIILITSYLVFEQSEGSIFMHKHNHDACSSYSSSRNCQPKVAIMFYVGGITRTLSIYS